MKKTPAVVYGPGLTKISDGKVEPIIPDDRVTRAFAALKHDTPRAVGIVAASLVDEFLAQAIRCWLHGSQSNKDDLFGRSGPLATFSARIDLGQAIGIFGNVTHKELHTIRKVRNAFAHDIGIDSFDNNQVCDLANNLVVFQNSRITISALRFNEVLNLVYTPPTAHPATCQERYVMACTYYVTILSALTPDRPQAPQPFLR